MSANQSQSLLKKVVLVTGGGSGIGMAIAESFLKLGASVHICDVSRQMLDDCRESNPEMESSLCDVSDPLQVDALMDTIESSYGRLDILINNAGIAGPAAAVEDIEIADWQKTLDIDISGAFYVTRRAVPLLKRAGKGSIVNMSSSAGLLGCPLRSPYVASKWAMVGLSKTWAMELGPFNIRVNAICPGSVEGPRIDGVIERDAAERGLKPEEIRQLYQQQSSLRKFISAEDVANMATFLCSDAGASISGQALSVDGHTETLSIQID
jgi:NAD(P)-dependent dehydrogenase (short-subunit alcohol dehydrogenase family)